MNTATANPGAGDDDNGLSDARSWVLVTRPRAQAHDWVCKLRAHGVHALALPLIDIGPAPDPAAVRSVFAQLTPGSLLMFVSPNAVAQFVACLPSPLCWPAGVGAAATGPGTVAALAAAGVPAVAVVAPPADAPQFDSEALWAQLHHQPWVGRSVWVVRGEGGRDWFAQTLAAAGAQVGFIQAYRRAAPLWRPEETVRLARQLQQPQRGLWLFSSSEAIDHLCQACPGTDWQAHTAWASHPRIVNRARAAGFGQVQSCPATLEALVQHLHHHQMHHVVPSEPFWCDVAPSSGAQAV